MRFNVEWQSNGKSDVCYRNAAVVYIYIYACDCLIYPASEMGIRLSNHKRITRPERLRPSSLAAPLSVQDVLAVLCCIGFPLNMVNPNPS